MHVVGQVVTEQGVVEQVREQGVEERAVIGAEVVVGVEGRLDGGVDLRTLRQLDEPVGDDVLHLDEVVAKAVLLRLVAVHGVARASQFLVHPGFLDVQTRHDGVEHRHLRPGGGGGGAV